MDNPQTSVRIPLRIRLGLRNRRCLDFSFSLLFGEGSLMWFDENEDLAPETNDESPADDGEEAAEAPAEDAGSCDAAGGGA